MNNLYWGALNKVGPIAPPPTVPLLLQSYITQYMTQQMGLIFIIIVIIQLLLCTILKASMIKVTLII